jgi:aspartyl-tRNA(Asn)/glutamyl-tRNA(Gln) amidotransferase subunit A
VHNLSHPAGWFGLASDAREHAARACRERVITAGIELNAVVTATTLPCFTGPLAGLPYVTKDMFDRQERRAEWGGVRAPGRAQHDAEILRRLDKAGGAQIAVSRMTALAYEPSGYHATQGRTRNPWHADIVSGGSSSGSAALIAVGAGFLGLGSDTGGSIRIPAACCGIVGLKPGWGSISNEGAMQLAPSLDTIGFFARMARDLVPVWHCARDTPEDSSAIKTVAVLGDAMAKASPQARIAINAALAVLSSAGIKTLPADTGEIVRIADERALTVMQGEAARIHENDSVNVLDPSLRKRLSKGLAIADAAIQEALDERATLRDHFVAAWRGAEAAVLPVMPLDTPLAVTVDPTERAFDARTLYGMSSLTRFVNYLGLPALSLPIGFDNRGAPIGVQVIGRTHGESALLELATAFQARSPWHLRLPPVHSLSASERT